ncbi:MAG: 2-octaprenyl-3-methyl-6-methoxy-1,4-benzoquinol hydroxylase [Gammaproteobacteria bacterium RIFCSPHIGHO2_12_FULL_37_14]|nr:MAG: 2-octaprenyl-3-methyl-6-methoxy-1,4-benzoquinol hydroxylase [Gammaproteobacteria bacterium RIFCSPHIGHO2_12_FULL_37_14]
MKREYSIFDKVCLSLDRSIRTLNHCPQTTGKSYPAQGYSQEVILTEEQRVHSAGLMRVNHAGEICAQALYHGQALVSSTPVIKEKMEQAAIEEGDHLVWCEKRLRELDSHTSYLNPFWYAGSFGMGILAGIMGDRWSLGFVAETETQVITHLEKHRHLLPEQDQRSDEILKQMERDETQHRADAITAGARELPWLVKKAMTFVSKVMVTTAYWI